MGVRRRGSRDGAEREWSRGYYGEDFFQRGEELGVVRRILRNESGFTMVEMMIVLVIIAVLIGTGVGFYQSYVGKSKRTKAKAELSVIQAALDAYYAENDRYPATHEELAQAGVDASIVSIGGNTKYNYTYIEGNNKKYKIYTTTPQGGYYVVASGDSGRSFAPVETTTSPAP